MVPNFYIVNCVLKCSWLKISIACTIFIGKDLKDKDKPTFMKYMQIKLYSHRRLILKIHHSGWEMNVLHAGRKKVLCCSVLYRLNTSVLIREFSGSRIVKMLSLDR